MLVQGRNTEAVPDLEALVEHCKNPKARLQALCTLAGLSSLTSQVLAGALKDEHWAVRRQAVTLSETHFGESVELDSRLLTLENDPDVRVRYQLAFSLGEWRGSKVGQTLGRLMLKDWENEAMQTAVLSSVIPHLDDILRGMFMENRSEALPGSLVERLVGLTVDVSSDATLSGVLDKIGSPAGSRYADWQVAGVAGLIDALERRDLSLAAFQAQAGPALRKVLSRLDPIFDQAKATASDSNAAESERVSGCWITARTGRNRTRRC